jgi:sugar-specific transcriptional regulator TrmB
MSAHETLAKLGLNDKEIKVYTCLLKTGRLTPAALSRITKINRATVYNIAQNLLGKGIITEDRGKTLYLAPLPIDALHQLIERPKRELDTKKELVTKAMAELSLITPGAGYSVPKIRFVEEDNLEDFLYENGKKWVKELKKTDGIWWSFQDHTVVEHYKTWIEWISNTPEYKDAHVSSRILSNDSDIERQLEKKIPRTKRAVRFIPGLDFTAGTWVSGDYIVMIVTQQHPFHLLEIHDATLAHNMREVLRKLWELSEK